MIIANKKNLKSVVILEDDADIQNNYNKDIKVPKDADMVYIGGSFFEKEEKIPKYLRKLIKVDTDIFKIAGTFGYIIPNSNTIQDIINVTKSVFLPGKGKDKHKDWRGVFIQLWGY